MKRHSRPLALPRRLLEAVATLDRERLQLLDLWLRGLDLPEIAAETGLPEATAAARLREAIERTRRRLEE